MTPLLPQDAIYKESITLIDNDMIYKLAAATQSFDSEGEFPLHSVCSTV